MTHLSENERSLLMNFLPRGIEPHQVVEDLLAGTDFGFGNPFLNWQDIIPLFFSLWTLCAYYL
jgi:hypothetical protein